MFKMQEIVIAVKMVAMPRGGVEISLLLDAIPFLMLDAIAEFPPYPFWLKFLSPYKHISISITIGAVAWEWREQSQ